MKQIDSQLIIHNKTIYWSPDYENDSRSQSHQAAAVRAETDWKTTTIL